VRVEIKCAHPFAKREYYGPGWICETSKGGCGATGSEERAHYSPVIGYADVECPECAKRAQGA